METRNVKTHGSIVKSIDPSYPIRANSSADKFLDTMVLLHLTFKSHARHRSHKSSDGYPRPRYYVPKQQHHNDRKPNKSFQNIASYKISRHLIPTKDLTIHNVPRQTPSTSLLPHHLHIPPPPAKSPIHQTPVLKPQRHFNMRQNSRLPHSSPLRKSLDRACYIFNPSLDTLWPSSRRSKHLESPQPTRKVLGCSNETAPGQSYD